MLDEKEIRQLALEKIVSSHNFSEDTLLTLGRILSLKERPEVTNLYSDDESLSSYDVALKKKMDAEEIRKMLVEQGLNPGGQRWENERIPYGFSSRDLLFSLYIHQPKIEQN